MHEIMDPALRKAGKSALYCTGCNQHLSKKEQSQHINQERVHLGCIPRKIKARVIPSSARFLYDTGVSGPFWYHSTFRPAWMSDVLNASTIPIVHIGSRYAALDRAKHKSHRYLFKVTVDAEATVDPNVLEDVTEGWEDEADLYEYDVTRYINIWESPGSISLLVKPTALTILDQRLL